MSHLLHKQIVGTLLALSVFVAVPVMAHEGADGTTSDRPTTTARTENGGESEHPSRLQGKLSDIRKKICENRVTRISQIMTKAASNGTKLLETFDKGLTRVETFYVSKKLSVANYDSLVATANAKKQAAMDAIQAVKDNTKFDCTSDNPVGKIDAFNGKVKAMHQALKDFRSSVRDIIKAIKPAAEAKEGSQQ